MEFPGRINGTCVSAGRDWFRSTLCSPMLADSHIVIVPSSQLAVTLSGSNRFGYCHIGHDLKEPEEAAK
jgi:hypothetical protein